MFYDIFLDLCNKKNVKPNNVTKAIGLSTATATHWKNGVIPNDITLKKLADYFGVSVEYLKGETDEKVPADSFSTLFNQLSESEREIICKAMEEIIKSRTTRN